MSFKRILSLFLCIIMIATCALPLASCGGGNDKKCDHADDNGDKICDKCEIAVEKIDCEKCADTNNNGKCDKCGKPVNGSTANGKTLYTVKVATTAGMPLKGVTLYVHKPDDGGFAGHAQTTDANGVATFELDTKAGYTVELYSGIPDGYVYKKGSTEADRYPMGDTGATITLNSKPVTEGGLKSDYLLGDVMYDFTIKDINGKEFKLSELLKEKKMVMLNFWYIDCSWCNKEFPGLNDSYVINKDLVEILAINDYATDTEAEVKSFPTTGSYAEDNLTFPFFKVAKSDTTLTIDKFGGFGEGKTGYPTTVIIDRYGVICMIEQGAIVGQSKWDKIFKHFTADKYEQKLITDSEDLTPPEKPNISWGGSDSIAANLNGDANLNVEYAPETNEKDAEYSWPFIAETVEGVKVVRPSNKSDNSYSIMYANIRLKPGQAVIFDYFTSCESGSDRLVVLVNGDDICSLTGVNGGKITDASAWEVCGAYVDPRPYTESNKNDLVTYKLAFSYIKDTEGNAGDDTVYLKNLRVVDAEDIPTETYIIRDAVSDPTSDGAGFNAYIKYALGKDGYYHVVKADGSEGPLILANFLSYTNFDPKDYMSSRIMAEGKILVNGVDKYTTWMVYANASSNSSVGGYTPVTEELKEILVAYCNQFKNTVGKENHADLWLQLCIYYDAYGKDENGNPAKPVEDPIKGLTSFSAYEVEFKENPAKGDKVTYSVTYDRVIMPRGLLYRISPKTSGAYRITSRADQEVNGWVFSGTSYDWILKDNDRDTVANYEEEERYCPVLNIPNEDGEGFTRDFNNLSMVVYLEAGKEYFIDIAYYDIYAEGTFEFDITYEGAELNVFVMASPGPITYIETSSGGIGGLIALGIDYEFKADTEGGTKYAYHVIERDEDGNVTKWGEKIYADFYYPTIPFPSQSIQDLYKIDGAFDFDTVSEKDIEAKVFLEKVRALGKAAIIEKWISDEGISEKTAEARWNEKNLDFISELVQSSKNTTDYEEEDVKIATEAIKLGKNALMAEWGADADKLWNQTYKMDDVAKGIYHGANGKDAIAKYLNLIEEDPSIPERMGCVAVTEELSIILSGLYSKHVFEDVENDWLKFCFYYKQLGN